LRVNAAAQWVIDMIVASNSARPIPTPPGELTDFRTEALARLAAQHEEITRLRQRADHDNRVRRLPRRTSGPEACS
jgi:hypothetical protein